MADAFDMTPLQQVADTEGPGAANEEVAPTTGPRDEPAAPGAGAEAAAEASADYSGLRLPEGYRADDPVFGEAMKLFGSERIAPETAQKLIDFTVERDREIARAVNDHAASSWTKQTTEWRATSEKEFSPEALGNARTALAKVS